MSLPITIKTKDAQDGWMVITDAEASSGNSIVVSGNYGSGATLDFKNYIIKNSGDVDSFIAKYDAYGDLLWSKQISGLNSEQVKSVGVDPDGNIYATGYFAGSAVFGNFSIESTKTPGGAYSHDIFITKLTKDGDFVWVKKVGGAFDETTYGNNSISVQNDGVVFTGGFGGTA